MHIWYTVLKTVMLQCILDCVSRFTKDSVIVTAPTKVKSGCDLQLPSMATLTSKTSSQAFFLRILKVIVQIRESVRLARRRNGDNNGKVPRYDFTLKRNGLQQVKVVDMTCKYLTCQSSVAEDPCLLGCHISLLGK